ncbi:MAG TPA: glycosyltransferase family 1 protein [Vicinamibacterales bacterium]|nr:glycosyltransferase family 1 protein [Vicinamibacterales bacterium]
MDNRPLHIAIDGRELVGKPTGAGRYLTGLMAQWARTTSHRYTVVLHAEPGAALRQFGDRFTWRVEPAAIGGTLWEQRVLPRAVHAIGADVLLAPAYTAPLRSPAPFVVVIHDVSYFAHPEWFPWREGLRRRLVTRRAARRARRIVTISEFSRAEIERYLDVPASRIDLAPPGAPEIEVGPHFRQPLAPEIEVGPHFRQPLVLYAGSLFNRRHVAGMIQAFAQVAREAPDARLVLVGDNRTSPREDPRAIARDSGVADRVEWREYATDAELAVLYRSARVFLFLSDYEGFGIPPLEAFAHGVPAVVLDTPISREVYGDGAIRVSADAGAIAGAMARLLTNDSAHGLAVAAGRARLSAYSWARSAAVVTRALEEAAR